MTLRGKLLLAQAPLGLGLALVGMLAVRTIASLGDLSQAILEDNYRSTLAVQRMTEAVERMDSAALFVVAGERERGLRQAAEYRPRFEAELRVQERNITEPGEPEATARLRRAWTAYQAAFDRFVAQGDGSAARQAYFAELEPVFTEVKAAAYEILAMNQDGMVRKSDRARLAAERMNALMALAAAAALGLGLLASATLTRRLLRPLSVLGQAARRIGQGDLAARAGVGGHDEIARLAADFNGMADQLAAYRASSLGELLEAQQAAQATIDSLSDPVVILGVAGRLVARNEAADVLLGPAVRADAAGLLAGLDPALRDAVARVRGHVLGGKGSYTPRGFEEAASLSTPTGERAFLPRGAPVYGPDGTVTGVAVVLQDVTRLRRLDELRSDLVATVAHELRTPLTSLALAVHLLAEEAAGPLTARQADLLHAAREDCHRLKAMVDELLDLSRIEAGRAPLHLEATPAGMLVGEAASAHRSAAEAGGLTLTCEVDPDVDTVLVDRERVAHVFSNLLANAIRHTPQGGEVRVRARRDGARVRVEVADTGPGIPAEHQARVFDRFYRVPGTGAGEGTGLGLSIAREIVRAHGGEIGVESDGIRGSTFWFTLPGAG